MKSMIYFIILEIEAASLLSHFFNSYYTCEVKSEPFLKELIKIQSNKPINKKKNANSLEFPEFFWADR